jgi:hypothetical protein
MARFCCRYREGADDRCAVSAVTAACRDLWGNPNPSAVSVVWSMQHPVWMALAWSIALLVVCLPLASLLYWRRTTD